MATPSGARSSKKPGLGGDIAARCAVIIEMVVPHVRDAGDIDLHARQTLLCQGMTRNFEHGVTATIGFHARQPTGQSRSRRRRVIGRANDFAVAIAERAEHPQPVARGRQNAGDQMRGRGFAIRAGDPDHPQSLRRIPTRPGTTGHARAPYRDKTSGNAQPLKGRSARTPLRPARARASAANRARHDASRRARRTGRRAGSGASRSCSFVRECRPRQRTAHSRSNWRRLTPLAELDQPSMTFGLHADGQVDDFRVLIAHDSVARDHPGTHRRFNCRGRTDADCVSRRYGDAFLTIEVLPTTGLSNCGGDFPKFALCVKVGPREFQTRVGVDKPGKMTRQWQRYQVALRLCRGPPKARRTSCFPHVAPMPDEDFDIASLADYLHLEPAQVTKLVDAAGSPAQRGRQRGDFPPPRFTIGWKSGSACRTRHELARRRSAGPQRRPRTTSREFPSPRCCRWPRSRFPCWRGPRIP